jgi:hypothetical protein
MTFIFVELLTLLVTLSLVFKFKLHSKFLSRILKTIQIYLPPTDSDFELITDMKKGKSANPQASALVRSCGAEEYLSKINVEQSTDLDLVVVFYITSFINMGGQLAYSIANFYFKFDFDPNQDESSLNTINVIASFSLINIFYVLSVFSKSIFRAGYFNYEGKIFLIISFIGASVMLTCLRYQSLLFNINTEDVCQTVNGKIQLIIAQANGLSASNLVICDSYSLNIFLSFVFSFSLAFTYRSSMRMSSFDNFLSEASSQTKENHEKKLLNTVFSLPIIIKLKQIFVCLLLLLLIDPLLKSYLLEKNVISEQTFYLFIILPIAFIVCYFEFTTHKYYFVPILNFNYNTMLEFCKNPNKNDLLEIRKKMQYVNEKFWEIFLNLFNLIFISFFSLLYMLHRSNLFEPSENIRQSKTNLVETISFFILYGILTGKAVFGSFNLYYMKHYQSNKKILFI